MHSSISVLIVDHQPLFRDSLQAGLAADGLDVVATTGDGPQALRLVAEHGPDVVVMEPASPQGDGTALVRRIASHPGGSARVLVLSAADSGEAVYRAIAAGASGYITKDTDCRAVCHAVRAVAGGRGILAPGLGDGLFAKIRGVTDQALRITEREHQVLLLAAEGRTVTEMGRQLYLSPGTVKTHLAHVYGKLGVSDRGAAVAEAMRRELIA